MMLGGEFFNNSLGEEHLGHPLTNHHWGKPLYGYYNSYDSWVYKKHAILLSDAEVDFIVIDFSNHKSEAGEPWTFDNTFEILCESWAEMRKMGVRTPQIAFMGNLHVDPNPTIQFLFDNVYHDSHCTQDLFFQLDGKPLMYSNFDTHKTKLKDNIKNFFTFRSPKVDYDPNVATKINSWSWLSLSQQSMHFNSNHILEQMSVSPAQNGYYLEETTQTKFQIGKMGDDASKRINHGRTWISLNNPKRSTLWFKNAPKDRVKKEIPYGHQFQEQWDYALQKDPLIILVTGWNEWIASRYTGYMDTYNAEFSRDIEPSRDPLIRDYYYTQMMINIAAFKKLSTNLDYAPRVIKNAVSISDPTFKLSFDLFKQIPDYYNDPIDAFERGYDSKNNKQNGYGPLHYTKTLVSNDIIKSKVIETNNHLYFYVEYLEETFVSPESTFLFIGLEDKSKKYFVTFNINDNPYELSWKSKDSKLIVEVPKKLLPPKEFIEFKWIDIHPRPKAFNPLKFYIYGESAPNGRLHYIYQQK